MQRNKVFISYSRLDQKWLNQIKEFLAPVVRDCLDVWDDSRTPPGAKWFDEIQRALDSASVAVLLVSQHFLSSEFILSQELPKLLEAADRDDLTIIWVPVSASGYLYSPIADLQAAIDPRKPLECVPAARRKMALVAIADAIAQAANIQPPQAGMKQKAVLLYKRWSDLDEEVVQLLDSELRKRGMAVFIDRCVPAGVAWGRRLADEISQAEIVIPLISEGSINSEMLAREVGIAFEAARKNGGTPRMLPIRLAYHGRLPKNLELLNPIQHIEWESNDDNDRVLGQLWRAIRSPAAAGIQRAEHELPQVEDTYIERESDGELDSLIRRGERLIVVKGARQIGTTSLIGRCLQKAQKAGARAVYTDFQSFNANQLSSAETMYRGLAESADESLNLDTSFDDEWRAGRAPNLNLARYLKRRLTTSGSRVVWALDEVDRLFTYPWAEEFFRFLRSWYNDPTIHSEARQGLTFVVGCGKERYEFITGLNESPFNIGLSIQLRDFNREEISDLAYRSGVAQTSEEIARIHDLLGGHPFLIRTAIAELQKTPLDDLLASAKRDDGPFGDHLRGMLMIIISSGLLDTVRRVLSGETSISPEDFVRLRCAGILAGDSHVNVRFRCRLYREYLARHLHADSKTAGEGV